MKKEAEGGVERTIPRSYLIAFMIFIIAIIGIIISSSNASAIPPIPDTYYGTFSVNHSQAGVGTQIIAKTSSGIQCGSFKVVNMGYYGLLTCKGDDNQTAANDGASLGQNVSFYLGSTKLLIEKSNSTYTNAVSWDSGGVEQYNIRTPAVCGDGICDAGLEVCDVCILDCGICPGSNLSGNYSGNYTGNNTNMTGNYSGGGGTSGGSTSGGSSGSTTPSGGGTSGGAGAGGGQGGGAGLGTGGVGNPQAPCTENWNCTNWYPEVCPITEVQNRTCTDLNHCGTKNNEPKLSQSCTYTPTCTDGYLNGIESDVDCGGNCPLCTVGKTCRTNSDCVTGRCDPSRKICLPATCSDGIQNQGETGIDCGGPCAECQIKKPGTEVPLPPELKKCGFFPYKFFLEVLALTLLFFIARRIQFSIISHLNKYKELTFEEQARKRIRFRHFTYWIVLTVVLADIAVGAYVYFFCTFSGMIVLFALLILVSLASYVIKAYLAYDEKKAEARYVALLHAHKFREERMLILMENEIDERIETLTGKYKESKDESIGKMISDLSNLHILIEGFKKLRKYIKEFSEKAAAEDDLIGLAHLNEKIREISSNIEKTEDVLTKLLESIGSSIENGKYSPENFGDEEKTYAKDTFDIIKSYKEALDSEIEEQKADSGHQKKPPKEKEESSGSNNENGSGSNNESSNNNDTDDTKEESTNNSYTNENSQNDADNSKSESKEGSNDTGKDNDEENSKKMDGNNKAS